MEIVPLGDSALIVRVRDRFEDAPDKTLTEVLGTFRRLQDAAIPGVIELAPAYTTVAVFFDPTIVANEGPKSDQALDWLTDRIRIALSSVAAVYDRRSAARSIEIPVCYDPEFAFDLENVAHHAQISSREVVDLHSAAEYRVSCIGFVPGFPFLAGLPRKLATPRRATPRKEIPAGSVGIGGAQTGIYPLRSPGGWNLIGRTPVRLFDPEKTPPAFLRAGDRVHFRAITREEFEALAP
ncbi:MAG TPA: 5-oxoprolinase subunit PxpB [Candidatus Udaeobacter sp.]|jgi:inhibitor of KinA|nr:5-oxoprolinase subunit PxpB [Candidatus Udaeobacter sp.]